MINKIILLKIIILSCCIFAQNNNDQDLLNKLIKEKNSFSDDSTNFNYNKNISFKQLFTINNGLPNLENRNGIYAPNGVLTATSAFFGLNQNSLSFHLSLL